MRITNRSDLAFFSQGCYSAETQQSDTEPY